MSSLTHLIGAGVFAFLSRSLIWRGRGSWTRMIALGVFALSAVVLLCVSGLFHIFPYDSPWRQFMLRLDSAAIFVLIAGTYTPLHVIMFKGIGRWGFLSVVWGFAIVAIVFTTMYFSEVPRWMSLTLYLVLGWMSFYSATVIALRHGFAFIHPIILGGLSYTIGGTLNLYRMPNLIPGYLGHHEIFHVAVLIGLSCHWYFTYQIATGEDAIPKTIRRFDNMAIADG